MHPRTYFPLAYAAAPADQLLNQLAADIQRIASWGSNYYDSQFARAVTRRLNRDAAVRDLFEASITSNQTSDAKASQLSSLLAVTAPISISIARSLASRLHRQVQLPVPDLAHDYLTASDVTTPVLLLRLLDPGNPPSP
jgi:hypothetical protein